MPAFFYIILSSFTSLAGLFHVMCQWVSLIFLSCSLTNKLIPTNTPPHHLTPALAVLLRQMIHLLLCHTGCIKLTCIRFSMFYLLRVDSLTLASLDNPRGPRAPMYVTQTLLHDPPRRLYFLDTLFQW